MFINGLLVVAVEEAGLGIELSDGGKICIVLLVAGTLI